LSSAFTCDPFSEVSYRPGDSKPAESAKAGGSGECQREDGDGGRDQAESGDAARA
jgi:hypothetical protein